MKLLVEKRSCWPKATGFTLVEEVVAMGIVSMLVFASLSSVTFSRAQRFRDREAGMVTDFLTHYAEHLKALPFDQVASGRPINALYDGTGEGPRITIPPSGQWTSVTNAAYLLFHPDLTWIAYRNPQFRFTLVTQQVGGQDESKSIKLELRWPQPLSNRMLTNRMDLVRVKDV